MRSHKILATYITFAILQIPIAGGILSGSTWSTVVFGTIDALAFCIASIALIQRGGIHNSWAVRGYLAILLFFMWASLTALWSASDDLSYGMLLLLRDLLRATTILMAAGVLGADGVRRSLRGATNWLSVLYPAIFLTTASYAYDFAGAHGRLMYAGFKDANGPARDLGILLILAVWVAMTKRRDGRFLATGRVALLASAFLLSFSKAVFVALVIAALFSFVLGAPTLSKKMKGLSAAVVMALIAVAYRADYIYQYVFQVQGGGALETLSGRTAIWEVALDQVKTSYLFGAGLNSFSTFSSVLPNIPGSTHNEALNVLFSYGVVGLALWGSIYLTVWKYAGSLVDEQSKSFVTGILLYFLIVGLTESNIVGIVFPPYLLVLILGLWRSADKPGQVKR